MKENCWPLSVVVVPFAGLSWTSLVKNVKKRTSPVYLCCKEVIIRYFPYICGLRNEVLEKNGNGKKRFVIATYMIRMKIRNAAEHYP